MQQVLPAAAALLLAFWLLRRRRHPLLPFSDGRAVAALNRAQATTVEQVEPPVAPFDVEERSQAPLPAVAPALLGLAAPGSGRLLDPRGRRQLLSELRAAASSSDQERLAAMSTCLAWGDRASLPLLRRARFDPDPRVAALAAEGIAAFRGRAAAAAPGLQPARLPRNVARTR